MLALFASLYAEHGTRPEDLQAAVNGAESDSESDEDGWLATTGQAERKRKREVERDERWEDEVDHLTMSVKLWSLVGSLCC